MKTFAPILALAAVCLAAPALAGGPDSGFYLGGGAQFSWVIGTGTWDDFGFDVGEPMAAQDSTVTTIGLSWKDNLLLGLKPAIGYRLNPRWEIQAAFGLNISKSSQQIYSVYQPNAYYEQGLLSEWTQRNLELLAVYRPSGETGPFFYAGWDHTTVKGKITLYEGAAFESYTGEDLTDFAYTKDTDTIGADGVILGCGLELNASNNKAATFVAAQYSTAKTDDMFFDAPGFKVKVGGIAVLAGVKWFPFEKGAERVAEPPAYPRR